MGDSIDLIDFDGLITALDVDTATADFAALTTALQGAIDDIDNSGVPGLGAVKTQLQNHITEINRIEDEEYKWVSGNQTNMLNSIVSLNATAATVPDTIDTLLDTLNTTQVTLQTDGVNIIKNESKIFANRILGIADQFVEYVNKTIQQDLGKCKPVHNFYQSVLVNTLCGSVVDSLNGVWFTLGWCLFFMVFGTIFSVKLAKHVRKMDELHEEDHGDSNYGPGKGKVHPI